MINSDNLSDLHVVKESYVQDEVIVLKVHDIKNKNSFSFEIGEDLKRCLQFVNNNLKIKVVIITGYDTYFMTGGSKDELLKLHKGEMKFTDIDIYKFSLDCEVPVIAAMQGHAIGGGLVLGLFCDAIFASSESIYTFNFMQYGFTPGMGATLIAPYKLGQTLACEMLYSAGRYRGLELKQRGASFNVYPRKDVLKEAIIYAKQMSDMPRNSLVLLKNHLNKELLDRLDYYIEKELKLHNMTIHEDYVKNQIMQKY